MQGDPCAGESGSTAEPRAVERKHRALQCVTGVMVRVLLPGPVLGFLTSVFCFGTQTISLYPMCILRSAGWHLLFTEYCLSSGATVALRGYSNIIPDWYLLDDALCNNLWIVIYGPTFLTPPSWQDTIHVSVCDQQHKFSPVIPREKPHSIGIVKFL